MVLESVTQAYDAGACVQFYIALNYSTVGHPAKAMEDIKVCVGVTVCLTDHVLKVQMGLYPLTLCGAAGHLFTE